MKEFFEAETKRGFLIMQFSGTPDPRLVYNRTSNSTFYTSTNQFRDLCSRFGPCKEGEFEKDSNLFYLARGYPPLVFGKSRNKTFISLRIDDRMFGFIEPGGTKRRCSLSMRKLEKTCATTTGLESYKILWQEDLPYKKDILKLHWDVTWSYAGNTVVKVRDTEAPSGEYLMDYSGRGGRYYEMKMGDYPSVRLGINEPKGMGQKASLTIEDIDVSTTVGVFDEDI